MNDSLTDILSAVRRYLRSRHEQLGLALLVSMEARAGEDPAYAEDFRYTFLKGSTLDIRRLCEPFGRYNKCEPDLFPPYPFTDAVNGIDSGLHMARHPEFEEQMLSWADPLAVHSSLGDSERILDKQSVSLA